MCFAYDDEESFQKLDFFLREAEKVSFEGDIFLVGCKSDVQIKVVKEEKVVEFARKNGMKYFKTSSKTGEGVKDLIEKTPKIIESYLNFILTSEKVEKKVEKSSWECLTQ